MAYLSNIEHVKTICFEYAQKHFNTLILLKDGVHSIGTELFLDLIEGSRYNPVDLDSLIVDSMPSTMIQDLKLLFEAREQGDGTLIFANQEVTFHKAILQAQSSKANELIQVDGGIVSKEADVFPLSSKSFEAALAFLYYRENQISTIQAAEIIPLALRYDLKALYDLCEKIITDGVNEQTVIPVLRLCYHKEVGPIIKDKIYDTCIDYIIQRFAKIDIFAHSVPLEMSKDIIVTLQSKINQGTVSYSTKSNEKGSQKIRSQKFIIYSAKDLVESTKEEDESLTKQTDSESMMSESYNINDLSETSERKRDHNDSFYDSSESENVITTTEEQKTEEQKIEEQKEEQNQIGRAHV